MIARLTIALALLCSSLSAATYYVRKDGSNSNDGTADNAGGAWLTINYAATNTVNPVAAGATIYVRAGIYAEYVTLTRAGTSGNPITWVGAANLATIIDPSVEVAGWVSDSANFGGQPVWKRTGLTFEPSHLSADGYALMRMKADRIYPTATWQAWLGSTPTATRSGMLGSAATMQIWDGIEAAWTYQGGVGYIRFRDGSAPSTHTIKVSSNAGLHGSRVGQAPLWVKASYNTVSGFHIRGGHIPVAIQAPGGITVSHVNILSNRIEHGYVGVMFGDMGEMQNVHYLAISGNVITPKLYGEKSGTYGGPWGFGGNVVSGGGAYSIYDWSKFWWDTEDGVSMQAIQGWNSGNSNTIAFNTITNGSVGITVDGYLRANSGAPSTYLTIASNTFANLASGAITLSRGTDMTFAHDNYATETHFFVRLQGVNYDGAARQQRWYVYRNRYYAAESAAAHWGYILYGNVQDYVQTFQTELWFYNNSCFASPGVDLTTTSSPIYAKTRFLNNIMLSRTASATLVFGSGDTTLGRWVYNRTRAAVSGWSGYGNVVSTDYEWADTGTVPDFLISTNSIAWEAATNLVGIGLTDTRTMEDDAWDIGWHEYVNEDGVETPPVSLSLPNGSSVFEGATTTVRITRAGVTTGLLSGTWTITGTADNGTHYTTIPSSWAIDIGATYEDVTVETLTDGSRTGDLTLVFELNAQEGYTVAGSPVTITRRDIDQAPVSEGNPPLPGSYFVPPL